MALARCAAPGCGAGSWGWQKVVAVPRRLPAGGEVAWPPPQLGKRVWRRGEGKGKSPRQRWVLPAACQWVLGAAPAGWDGLKERVFGGINCRISCWEPGIPELSPTGPQNHKITGHRITKSQNCLGGKSPPRSPSPTSALPLTTPPLNLHSSTSKRLLKTSRDGDTTTSLSPASHGV